MPPRNKSHAAELERDQLPRRDFRLPEKAEWGGFINVRVLDDQKVMFEEWHENNGADVPLLLSEMLGSGLKVTLAYDDENDSWLCSLTGRLVADSDERFVTTTRAGSMAEVIALTCYKHVYIMRGVYQRYANNHLKQWG